MVVRTGPQIKKEPPSPDGPGTIVPFCKRFVKAGSDAQPPPLEEDQPTEPDNQIYFPDTQPAPPEPAAHHMPTEKAAETVQQQPKAANPATKETPKGASSIFYYKKQFMPEHVHAEWERICALTERGAQKNQQKRTPKQNAESLEGVLQQIQED